MNEPTVFTRQSLQLHALLLENQPWFCARDLGRLMGLYLHERMVSKLDEDQRQTLEICYYGQPENMLMISESGVYALLVYHYSPGHRLLREWLTHQVVPTLRDKHQPRSKDRPMLSLLDWPEMSLSLLHWQMKAGFGYETCHICYSIELADGRQRARLGFKRWRSFSSHQAIRHAETQR